MSAPASPRSVYSAVSDLEADVCELRGFVEAFLVYGTHTSMIPQRAIFVLAEALEALASRLETHWKEAHRLAAEAAP